MVNDTPDPIQQATVVTACDSNFVWGAMLLGLSLRYHRMNSPYHILGYDLSKQEIEILSSIPNTSVYHAHKTSPRSVCTQKPAAIATADTEVIVWMDADCLVSGNLEKHFVCPQDKIQIRWRGTEENATIYRDYYLKHDTWGGIPGQILREWQKDVADLDSSRIATVCQTNCFVINRSHLGFIERWNKQMEKVIPQNTTGVYEKTSLAYSMTDESALNSLFAFSSEAPSTHEYQMDRDAKAACLHFGLNPKPWQHWTKQSLNHYRYVMDLINWAKSNDILLPPLPISFKPEYKFIEVIMAYTRHLYRVTRYNVSSRIRIFKHSRV